VKILIGSNTLEDYPSVMREAMRHLLAVVALFGLSTVVLTACSGPGSPFPPIEVDRVDIMDAQALLIASGIGIGSSRIMPASESSLFKVTSAGTVERINTYVDGALTGSLAAPDAVFEAGSDYVVLVYPSTSLLVRSSDGAVFDLGVRPSDLWSERFINRSRVRLGTDGTLYIPIGVDDGGNLRFAVHMIRNATTETPQLTRITPEADSVFAFAVAATGHIAYDGAPQARVVSPNGVLTNLPRQANVWTTPNGLLHFSAGIENSIYQVNVAGDGTVTTSLWGEFPTASPFSLLGFKIELNGRLYWVDRLDTNGQHIIEFFNDEATPRVIHGHELVSIKAAGASAGHLYVAGTDESFTPRLLRWDPSTELFTDWIAAGALDVYAMTVLDDGTLIVAATRMNDGARVIASVGPTGTLSVLEESSNQEVRDLIRLN
jgi:hypothetical protein